MAVRLTIPPPPPPPPRGNRGLGIDREIAKIAETIIAAQREGHVAPKEVANYLNGLPAYAKTRDEYTESSMRRMLRRAVNLGFPVHLQTRAEAGGRPRRARGQLQQEMKLRFKQRIEERLAALTELPITTGHDE